MKGLIFNIKRYSIHDGPGIRVTFFLKGCPLTCIWCHNPEGLSPHPSEITEKRKIGDREFVRRKISGSYYTVSELLEIAGREKIFMEQSGGGVTFSGGEPLMQPAFLSEALCAFRSEGYHTAVDTAGYCRKKDLESIIKHTDLFLFDLKHTDNNMHRHYTGAGNRLILENLEMLVQSGSRIHLRIPVIPGVNDNTETMTAMRDYIKSIAGSGMELICLLPYHRTGSSKYVKLGLEYRMEECKPPRKERMEEIREIFIETGIDVNIGG